MDADLSSLIELQRLDTIIDSARKVLTDLPQREAAVGARLAEATSRLESAKQEAAENQAARRMVEKDMAVIQARLAKFKDQTIAVKTNKEFHALQHEISGAQEEIQGFEDRILEFMMQADELAGKVKSAEADLASTSQQAAAERTAMGSEHAKFEAELTARLAEREVAASHCTKYSLGLFESIRRSKGVAVTEMKEGRCSVCQVRLRPQVAQIVRRNDSVNQCDSCGRILYYLAPPAPPEGVADAPPATPPA